MQVKIIYFASLRDASKIGEENIETSCRTVSDLFLELNKKYNFPLGMDQLRVAVNQKYVSFETELIPQAEIVFIPPVAGG